MVQANFTYDAPSDPAGLPVSVSVFADRPYLRDQIAEDLRGAGFRIGTCGDIGALLEGQLAVLGDVVLLDCPQVDAEGMAALCRLDKRVARSGSQLIVSTSLDALDEVFGCFDQSAPQILVNCTRGERVVAIGRILARTAPGRVREMSEDDRVALLHLSQQVEAIARQIDSLSDRGAGLRSLADRRDEFRGEDTETQRPVGMRSARPPLPDACLLRRLIRQRQARAQFFDAELFADPAWDMLLDLTAAYCEHQRVSVTSLCIASGVPPTTALRWIKQMIESGLFDRVEDAQDRRRAFISLSDRAVDGMARYFAEIGEPVAIAA